MEGRSAPWLDGWSGKESHSRAVTYALSPGELLRLQAWRAELEAVPSIGGDEVRGGTGESGVVLSPERYVPADGVLIQPGKSKKGQRSV